MTFLKNANSDPPNEKVTQQVSTKEIQQGKSFHFYRFIETVSALRLYLQETLDISLYMKKYTYKNSFLKTILQVRENFYVSSFIYVNAPIIFTL
jgi:hypothetical protein